MRCVSRRLETALALALVLAAFAPAAQAASAWRKADAATAEQAAGWMNSLTAGWTPNLGQIADSDGRVATKVLYSANIADAHVYVTTSGLSHYFVKRQGDGEGEEPRRTPGKKGERERLYDWARLDLDLKGAVIRPERARLENLITGQGSTHYYLPHCPAGVTNVPAYGQITFPDVYRGIDWVIRNEPGKGVHHDFVVRPGADAAQIRLEYAGATEIQVSDDERSLIVRTSLGEVREGALSCYQGDPSNPIGARFRIEGNAVSVVVDAYDRSRPLVIDPPLVWSTYYGGTGYDGPRSIYCDNVNDDIYIVGYNASPNLPVLNPGGGAHYQGSFAGFQDGFIWKFSQLGVREWATYYGGSLDEINADCTADASGNLYVCGSTASADFPTQFLAGAYNQAAISGPRDGFVLKFNAAGVRQWATCFGGTSSDYTNAITTDPAGRVFVGGTTTSSDMPLANPGGGAYFQGALGGTTDAFILRFSALGALEWATYYGGSPGTEEGYGIAAAGGSLYAVGVTRSTSFPTLNPGGGAYFQPALAGDEDTYIARFSLSGVQQWSTYFGGDSTDTGDEPTVDANGNLFVCGYTVSTNLPTVNPGGTAYFQGALAGTFDMFIAKFSASNAALWSTYFGGTDNDFLSGLLGKPLAVSAQGRVYMTGMTFSLDLPVVNPGGGSFYQGAFAGTSDATLTEFLNDGTLVWSTYFGTPNSEFGSSVSVGGSGCLFATGESVLPANLPTLNPGFGAWYQPVNAGSDDGYIAKFCGANSACCLDFTCVPVISQAQCMAMGGTTFFPGQSCSTTVCTIHCTICGRKYGDANRNGVQDNGETGLPGWTIALYYPNGPLYATTTTDANGNYCFNNIPCGTWTVTEVQQPGSVQTQPSTAAHTVTLGTGATQNNVNFGNFTCTSTQPCIGAPPNLAAWWPFNDSAGTGIAADITHGDPSRNVAQIQGGGSAPAPDALCLASATDYAVVPASDQLDLNFGTGSFAIAAWFDASSSGAGRRMIVEKRALASASSYHTRGWALYLDGLQSFLEIGTGGAPQIVPGPIVTPNMWSHLVVSIDRQAGQGRWYLDGTAATSFDFVPLTGVVSNQADLTIGQVSIPFGTAPGFQGCIGDLAIFSSALTAAAARKAYDPGPIGWCPEFALMRQVKTFCQSDSTVQVCFNLYNNTGAPKTYHWSMAGLPAGAGCSVAGPTQITPSAGVVVVPAASSSPAICVTIKRPAGLTAQNATACFGLTFFNDATGICRTRTGILRADNSCWCATPQQQGVVGVQARIAPGGVIGIGINPCDPIASVAYQVRAQWLEPNHSDPVAVSLNGLPPGTPLSGVMTAGPGAPSQIDVALSYPIKYDFAARYEIVLEADTDSDGNMERLSGTLIESTYDSTATVRVTLPMMLDRSVRLVTRPNPFFGGSTIEFTLAQAEDLDLGIYDLSGRLVRSLSRGQLAAGPHRFAWNGRDKRGRRVPAGVYFVRLGGGGRQLEAKVVKVQ